MSETPFGIHKDGAGATVIEYGEESIQVWSGLGMEEGSVTEEMVRTVFEYLDLFDCNVAFGQTFAELFAEARRALRALGRGERAED
jgi:hypothetical protein